MGKHLASLRMVLVPGIMDLGQALYELIWHCVLFSFTLGQFPGTCVCVTIVIMCVTIVTMCVTIVNMCVTIVTMYV